MASFVLKIKYEETLRRLTVSQKKNVYPPSPAMSFHELEESIRKMFKLPSSSEIVLRYTDTDNDVITLTCDEDLHDACAVQGLNPLRLHVILAAATLPPPPSAAATTPPGPPEFLKAAFAKARSQGFVPPGGFGSWGQRRVWSFPEVQFEPRVPSSIQFSWNDAGATSKGNAGNSTAPATAAPPPSPPVAADSPAEDGVRHFGVQCDACNMFPIVGPRFRSKKKFDFDLCQACFVQKKIECDDDEYTRIDRPLFHSEYFPSSSDRRRGAGCPAMAPSGCPVTSPWGWPVRSPSGLPVMNSHKGRPFFFTRGESKHGDGSGGCGSSFPGEFACESGGKLDARFVQDVTIFDGTEVAPGTTLTKIWRLRNSGSLPWPKESRLVHVGGDELGSVGEATLELPEQGLAPEEEVEASVDQVAPTEAGRYVSYWRLVAPSGQNFGHRLWVLIQVTPKDEESPQVAESVVDAQEIHAQDRKQSVKTSEEFASAAVEPHVVVVLQAQPEFKVVTPEIIAKNQQQLLPLDESPARAETVAVVEEEANPVEAQQQQQQQQIVGEKIVYPEIFKEATAAPVTGGVEELQAAVGDDDDADYPAKVQEAGGLVEASELGSFSVIETAMLPTLEGMGSKDKNLELLKPNKNDMQVTEWDLKLEELEEMGFSDKQLNFRLMLKNKGSLKHVVKELVQMYKASAAAKAV